MMKDTYYSHDRTFCSKKDCKETKCERNQSHVQFPFKYLSVADYSVTGQCLLREKESKDGK